MTPLKPRAVPTEGLNVNT